MKRRVTLFCLLLALLLLTACVRTSGKGSGEISASAQVGDFRFRLISMHTVYDLDEINPAHPLKIKLYVWLKGEDFSKKVWVTGDSWYSFTLDGIDDLYPAVIVEEDSGGNQAETVPDPAEAKAVCMTKADQPLHIWQGESVVKRLDELGRKLEPGNYTVTAHIRFYLDEALTEPFFCSLSVPITLK